MAIVVVVFMLCPFGGTIYSFGSKLSANFRVSDILVGVLFVTACITDQLDGHLARKYKWVSDWGKLWDPIADKVLINSVMILIAVHGLTFAWVPVLMIARDIIVDAMRMTAAKNGVVVPANIYGKLKTVFQMFALILILFFFNRDWDVISHSKDSKILYIFAQNGMMLIALYFSLYSGCKYVVDMQKINKKRN